MAIIGTYFPSKLEKRPHWEYAMYVAGALIDDLAMIVGDVNTGKHFLDEDRATFLLPEYIEKMECLGWNDAWRLLNPDGHESTWCSNAGNGFRLDHAYLSPQLQPLLQNAKYSHTEREDGVSDHSSYLIEIASPARANTP